MKKFLLGILLVVCLAISVSAQNTKLQGFCEDGGKSVITQGLTSTTKVQQSFPSCTVTVFDAGTTTPSTIFSNAAGTPKSNPFVAASDGQWFFYATPGTHYDVRFSSGGITSPFTIGDLLAPLDTSGGGGSVTSVNVSGGTTGLTTSGGPITTAGTITIAGTLVVSNGGTGVSTLTGVIKGNGTSPFSAATAGVDYVIPGSITTSGLTQATNKILGRSTASSGPIEEITVGSGLSLSGGSLSATGSGGTVTSVNVSGGSTGLTFSGGPITTSGIITAAGILGSASGGTGVNNGSSTITLGGNLIHSGAFSTTIVVTGNTNVTLPTSGTLVNSAVTTLSALSSIGTITSGIWNGTIITPAFGGTGLGTLTPYALIAAGTTATGTFQQVSGTGTPGQILTSNGAGVLPTWQTVSGTGTVTNSGTLTLGKAIIGNGAADVKATKLTLTDPATTATLTIADNSTFSTAGAFTTIITSTGNTAIILPTTGTLVSDTVTTLSSLSSIGTITTGTWQGTAIAFANGGTGLTAAADDTTLVSTGAAWQAKTLPNCTDTGGNHLNYDPSTNTFSCGTSGAPAPSIVVGTTSVSSGTSTRVLFNNAGILGEYIISGTGDVAMTTSPIFTTPTLGAASGTSLNLSSLTASQAVFTDASKNLVSNAITGTGNVVMSASPTFTGTIIASAATFSGLATFSAATVSTPVTLTDAATIATNAALGNRFVVSSAVDRTLGAPTNATDGQQCVWAWTNTDSVSHTLTLTSGAGGFAFGTTITATTATATNTTDYITAIFDSTANRWRVVGYSKGF